MFGSDVITAGFICFWHPSWSAIHLEPTSDVSYTVLYCSVVASSFVLTEHKQLNDAQRTCFENLSVGDYTISISIGLLNLGHAPSWRLASPCWPRDSAGAGEERVNSSPAYAECRWVRRNRVR